MWNVRNFLALMCQPFRLTVFSHFLARIPLNMNNPLEGAGKTMTCPENKAVIKVGRYSQFIIIQDGLI